MSINYYSAYNLVLESELSLPSFPIVPFEDRRIDVVITYGSVDPRGLLEPLTQGVTYQTTNNDFWLNVPGIVRFLVSNGTHIFIEALERSDEESIRAFLLSTCFEVLLRQRQLTVISGYALKLNEYGIAFAGNLGAGQSMLQGLFYKRGHAFLGGNFFVFNSKGHILPGSAQLEFWPAVVSTLELASESFKTIRPGIKKYLVPLQEQYCSRMLPLKIMYTWTMHEHEKIVFSEIDSENKHVYLQQLIQVNTPSWDLLQSKNLELMQSEYLDNLQIVNIHLPKKGLKLQQLVTSIENDLVKRGHCYV